MNYHNGLHFYINITNFDNVVSDEEIRTGKVNHSIHELDTFFSRIEAFGKAHYKDTFVVEKVTGARLHMYVLDRVESAFDTVSEISKFANKLASYLNGNVPKYKSLINFSIQIGACYGKFYDFTFRSNDIEEETSIGYAANYAAKLQALSSPAYISISSNIYEKLDSEYRSGFSIKSDNRIKKYGQQYYATILINNLKTELTYEEDLKEAKIYADKVNLGDIQFSSATQPIKFDHLSKTICKEVRGIPFFSDVRGFTSKFEEDDSNLVEMSEKTQKILATMYSTVRKYDGIHVQFQGDREMALFHDYGSYNCIEDAVQAGLRLIDKIHGFQVSVGIGESIGKLFAAKIGARGEKDNILLGTTVTEADRYEDELAGENQVVISKEIYEYLKKNKPLWADAFERVTDCDCYRTGKGFNQILREAERRQSGSAMRESSYNGAWRK